jgi:hypothetical protein
MAATQGVLTTIDYFNFPEGLDIVPLSVQRRQAGQPSSIAKSDQILHHPNNELEADDQQREWIERYGIAGRIW